MTYESIGAFDMTQEEYLRCKRNRTISFSTPKELRDDLQMEAMRRRWSTSQLINVVLSSYMAHLTQQGINTSNYGEN